MGSFRKARCFKVLIMVLALLVAFECGFRVLQEDYPRLDDVYFNFNLPPELNLVQGTNSSNNNASESEYVAMDEQAVVALLSTNSRDPFQLDLLVDHADNEKLPICPLDSPLLSKF